MGIQEVRILKRHIYIEISISKTVYRILTALTGEQRFDVALNLATKDLVRLKLQETEQQLKNFEQRYGMPFEKFQQAWESDQIADKYSYEVEKDYWEWETVHVDFPRLREMFEQLS
jgi:hypothetical protein